MKSGKSVRESVCRELWARIKEFNNCVLSSNLVECEHVGPGFTFCNGQIGRCRVVSRLDQFLCSPRVLKLRPQIVTKILGFGTSNHRALNIVLSVLQSKGMVTFRFTNSWVERLDFREVAWGHSYHGDPMYRFTKKLQRVKVCFKLWASNFSTNNELKELRKSLEDTPNGAISNGYIYTPSDNIPRLTFHSHGLHTK
ncbi:hypothetical protein ZOSMA_191G00150 [Zostera marina]|uniref:Uncharacterized protein n=1 Tax=Zostera marina TaxID=29655 RepID=A0A0K9PRN8_ZOSMR|nr:hypothetical protein ZOSMA_191G00150 [Zostera marina]